jgi:hypothetical protein
MNGNDTHELKVPDEICGDFKIVRHFDDPPLIVAAMGVRPLSRSRRIINKDIEAIITPTPNQSVDSVFEDMHIKVMQEVESSDYVSTLQNPDEEL